MTMPDSGRQAALRAVITDFLTDRLDSKLEKLAPDDPQQHQLRQQSDPPTWLADAAHRIGQLQAVTHHPLKSLDKKAKGTSLLVTAGTLADLPLVGSHCLSERIDIDVVGNAAALDVYKFLKLEHAGQSLLSLSEQRDPDWAAALSADPDVAEAWMSAFAGLTAARGKPASHTHTKQVYWLVGHDPHDDGAFHLLAPLYPTSLVHRVYTAIQVDRFGEAAKARRNRAYSEHPVHEYTDLAIQQLGGTKPQNISQLNSERRGNNLLLASLPPNWRSLAVRPLLGVDSLFDRFDGRRPVRDTVRQLRRFLESNPASIEATRQRVTESVNALVDELLYFGHELRALPPGWSQSAGCRLGAAQRHWLDPQAPRAEGDAPLDAGATEQAVAEQFARWLNHRLRKLLPMGDNESREWRKLALEQIADDDWEATNDE